MIVTLLNKVIGYTFTRCTRCNEMNRLMMSENTHIVICAVCRDITVIDPFVEPKQRDDVSWDAIVVNVERVAPQFMCGFFARSPLPPSESIEFTKTINNFVHGRQNNSSRELSRISREMLRLGVLYYSNNANVGYRGMWREFSRFEEERRVYYFEAVKNTLISLLPIELCEYIFELSSALINFEPDIKYKMNLAVPIMSPFYASSLRCALGVYSVDDDGIIHMQCVSSTGRRFLLNIDDIRI